VAADLAFLLGLLASSSAWALEGGQAAAPRHFGVVGTIAATRAQIGHGFPAVQIAPSWVLTAAHVAPPAGAVFADEFGISGISDVLTFPTQVPTVSPVPGALRDDLALVHLAKAIPGPAFPRLADEAFLPRAPLPAGFATMVSNNPSLNRRRYGYASLQVPGPVAGYGLALCTSGADADSAYLARGDSGSPVFAGRLRDTNDLSILIGIASAQASAFSGTHMNVYTRVGPYRRLLDRAVEASGEHLRWTEGTLEIDH